MRNVGDSSLVRLLLPEQTALGVVVGALIFGEKLTR